MYLLLHLSAFRSVTSKRWVKCPRMIEVDRVVAPVCTLAWVGEAQGGQVRQGQPLCGEPAGQPHCCRCDHAEAVQPDHHSSLLWLVHQY